MKLQARPKTLKNVFVTNFFEKSPRKVTWIDSVFRSLISVLMIVQIVYLTIFLANDGWI